MPYKFERDELVQLLIRAYDEGNCGFLDLSESVAEKIADENEHKFERSSFPTDGMPTMNDILNAYTARNFSQDAVHVDNLVIVNSNQMETDVSLTPKQFD